MDPMTNHSRTNAGKLIRNVTRASARLDEARARLEDWVRTTRWEHVRPDRADDDSRDMTARDTEGVRDVPLKDTTRG